MRSRRILEELDIRCEQSAMVTVNKNTRGEIITFIMVSGAHLCLVIISTTIVNFPGTCCLTNRINKFVYNNNGLGAYSFEFKTEDGTYRKEDGGIVTRTEGSSMVVRGEYGYVDPEGRYYTLKYIADANGFQPQLEEDTRFNDRRIV